MIAANKDIREEKDMGMIGYYFKLEQEKLDEVLSGEALLSKVAPEFLGEGYFDLDKSWMALGEVLAKAKEDTAKYVVPYMVEASLIPSAMEDGYEFGAFAIPNFKVKEVAAFLEGMTEEAFQQIYDFQELVKNEVYPLVQEDQSEEFLEYLLSYFTELRKYFKEAGEEGKALVFFIC